MNLLPIGSVVLLKNGTKKLVIIGYKMSTADNETVYDYISVLYPEGFINNNTLFLFNQEDINDIIRTGYFNEEHIIFMNTLDEIYNKEENENV